MSVRFDQYNKIDRSGLSQEGSALGIIEFKHDFSQVNFFYPYLYPNLPYREDPYYPLYDNMGRIFDQSVGLKTPSSIKNFFDRYKIAFKVFETFKVVAFVHDNQQKD